MDSALGLLGVQSTNPALHLLEHLLLNARAAGVEVRVVEGFEDLEFCKIFEQKWAIHRPYLVDHAIWVLIVEPSLWETGVRNNSVRIRGKLKTHIDE